jgi:arylformamidase
MRKYIDISVTLAPDIPVWEGDPQIKIYKVFNLESGDMANVSRMELGVHTGTHIDAPVHFVAGKKGADDLDLDILIGPVQVCEFHVEHEITAADLEAAQIPENTIRLLCKTSNSSHWEKFPSTFTRGFIGISADGAQWLVEHGIRLIGVDYLGVERIERVENGAPAHHTLLEAEVIILEGLNLSEVEPGEYNIICLPLKIQGSDGAPCRAVLYKEN